MVAFSLILALLLDRLLGEPARWHPLVGFGRLTSWIEQRFYPRDASPINHQIRGLLALLLLVLPLAGGLWWLSVSLGEQPLAKALFGALVLYLVIGGRSLEQHGTAVQCCLEQHDLAAARQRVGYIVSRDTAELDEGGINRAAIESLLENGSDALFAPIFWFVVAGPVAALVYRLVNTLDAMWGYKNSRYLNFGRAAARLDDVLNWLPARCCALSYALIGKTRQSLDCWRSQAPGYDSPNAGPVMAAGAGALNLTLGGPALYRGQIKQRPRLGMGPAPVAADIGRTGRFIRRALLLWLLAIAAIEGLFPWLL